MVAAVGSAGQLMASDLLPVLSTIGALSARGTLDPGNVSDLVVVESVLTPTSSELLLNVLDTCVRALAVDAVGTGRRLSPGSPQVQSALTSLLSAIGSTVQAGEAPTVVLSGGMGVTVQVTVCVACPHFPCPAPSACASLLTGSRADVISLPAIVAFRILCDVSWPPGGGPSHPARHSVVWQPARYDCKRSTPVHRTVDHQRFHFQWPTGECCWGGYTCCHLPKRWCCWVLRIPFKRLLLLLLQCLYVLVEHARDGARRLRLQWKRTVLVYAPDGLRGILRCISLCSADGIGHSS